MGRTVEERLEVVERQVRRSNARPEKRVIGLIPWLPISGRAIRPGEDGECFAFMFPLSGFIKQYSIFVEKLPEGKKEAAFTIEIARTDHLIMDTLAVKAKSVAEKVNYPVSEGMRVIVRTKEAVEGIWVSFLLEPSKAYYTPVKDPVNPEE